MRVASLAILLSLAAYNADTMVSPQSVILPAEFGAQLVHGCGVTTAEYEGDVTGYWSPGVEDAKQTERALPAYLKQTEVHRPFTDYYRQYVGIVAGSKRLVFVSAFASPSGVREKDFIPADWRDKPVSICGGSTDAWRVAFDPQTKQFSHWNVNGPL
jgi:hypothetical protein